MDGTPLTTLADFAHYLGKSESDLDAARVALLIAIVSGLVRDELRQDLDRVDDDEVDLIGTGSDVVLLPQLPVWDVTAVTETRGSTVTTLTEGTHYRLELGPDGRVAVLRRLGGAWPDGETVTVTYSHGYVIDSDSGTVDLPITIRAVALRVMARGIDNPAGKRQENIGRYGYTAGGSDAGLYLTAGDKNDLDPYRPGTLAGSR